MPDSADFLAGRLLSEGIKTIQFFKELPASQRELIIYDAGMAWSLEQVLAHLLATEINIFRLLENILAGGEGTPDDFKLDEFNQSEVLKLSSASYDQLISQFLEKRELTADLVKSLSETELSKRGRHPFLGDTQLADIIKLLYRHPQIHLREIRSVLSQESLRGSS